MMRKPAATGSGEPKCQCWNYMSDGCDLHGNRPLPTPPASQPTVTRTISDTVQQILDSGGLLVGIGILNEFLDHYGVLSALLRAAEQKS